MTTPGPWTIRRGGGHKAPSIVGSDSIHTDGHERNERGYSSASYSDEVCEIHADLDLPGPEANARLIAAAPELLAAAKHLRTQSRKPSMGCSWLCRNIQELFAAIATAEGTKP